MGKSNKLIILVVIVALVIGGYLAYRHFTRGAGAKNKAAQMRVFNRSLDAWTEKIYRAATADEPIPGWEDWQLPTEVQRKAYKKSQAKAHAFYQIQVHEPQIIPEGYIIHKNESTGQWSLVQE